MMARPIFPPVGISSWIDFPALGAVDAAHAGGHVAPDIEQIAAFLDVVFGYCDGLIPVRGFVDQGQGPDTKPHNIWVLADRHAAASLSAYATWAARAGSAVYVIPGTVAEQGQARAEHVLQMQTVVTDLDAGDIAASWRTSSTTWARQPCWSKAAAARRGRRQAARLVAAH